MFGRVATWARKALTAFRAAPYSVADPRLAEVFNVGYPNYSGVQVGESGALSIAAVYRAVALIAGTIGTLPMRTLRDTGDGMRQRVSSFLDTPGGPDDLRGPTAFEWKELVLAHLLLHGDAFLRHVYGGAGQLIALDPVHPQCVSVEWDSRAVGGKLYRVTGTDGHTYEFDATDMTQIMGLSLDGLRGLSVIAVARNGLGTAIAGERAAANMFSNGALMAGLVSAEDEVNPDEAKVIKETIDRKVSGWENAGSIAFINRKLKFTPWTMSAEDAQFLQSRAFQIEEIARWFGVPPHLLMQTEKQTSWGQGVEQQNIGLGRFTLNGWTTRIEQRLSRLLPNPRFVEFDFAGLERPTPESEIDLLIKQVESGLMTLNEARAVRNLPPVPGGDEVRGLTPEPAPAPEPAAEPELEAV